MLWAPFSESAAFFSIVVDQYQKYLLSVPGLQLHPSSQGIKWPHFDKSRQVGLGLRIRGHFDKLGMLFSSLNCRLKPQQTPRA